MLKNRILGSLSSKFCRRLSCALEFWGDAPIMLGRGCIPFYLTEDGCCPVGFRCRKYYNNLCFGVHNLHWYIHCVPHGVNTLRSNILSVQTVYIHTLYIHRVYSWVRTLCTHTVYILYVLSCTYSIHIHCVQIVLTYTVHVYYIRTLCSVVLTKYTVYIHCLKD